MLSLATKPMIRQSCVKCAPRSVLALPRMAPRRSVPRAAADSATPEMESTPTVMDLISKTRAWQRLNQLIDEKRFLRDDVVSFVHRPPMAGILEALLCHPDATAQMAADPALRASVENAVATFDSTLSEDDLKWLAEFMNHINNHSASYDIIDAIEESVDADTVNWVANTVPRAWEDAMMGFTKSPSPGAVQLLAAAKAFWTKERLDKFLSEAETSITPASIAAVRSMIESLHAIRDPREAAIQTMDILELALPPAELWAASAMADPSGPPLDFHDFMDEDFLDRMREQVAPC